MAKPNAAKPKAKRGAVHQDYLARMRQTLPSIPEPAPVALIKVEPAPEPAPSKPLDAPKAMPRSEPMFRTCERCGSRRPFSDIGPSKTLCTDCWHKRNGEPVKAPAPVGTPYFRLRMSVEEAFIALRNGRYSAALHVLEHARREHAVKKDDQ